jgi:hypothetical protein
MPWRALAWWSAVLIRPTGGPHWSRSQRQDASSRPGPVHRPWAANPCAARQPSPGSPGHPRQAGGALPLPARYPHRPIASRTRVSSDISGRSHVIAPPMMSLSASTSGQVRRVGADWLSAGDGTQHLAGSAGSGRQDGSACSQRTRRGGVGEAPRGLGQSAGGRTRTGLGGLWAKAPRARPSCQPGLVRRTVLRTGCGCRSGRRAAAASGRGLARARNREELADDTVDPA